MQLKKIKFPNAHLWERQLCKDFGYCGCFILHSPGHVIRNRAFMKGLEIIPETVFCMFSLHCLNPQNFTHGSKIKKWSIPVWAWQMFFCSFLLKNRSLYPRVASVRQESEPSDGLHVMQFLEKWIVLWLIILCLRVLKAMWNGPLQIALFIKNNWLIKATRHSDQLFMIKL